MSALFFWHAGMPWPGTFARAGAAYEKLGHGALRSVAAGVLRQNSFFELGGARYALVEPAGTQLHTFTEALENAAWTKAAGVTIDANSADEPVASPAGLMDGLVERDGVSQLHSLSQGITIAADTDVAVAPYALAGTRGWMRVVVFETANWSNRISAFFNLSTGALGTVSNVGTGSGVRAYIERMVDGRWRCHLAGNIGNGATALTTQYAPATAGETVTYVGDSSAPAIYLWGMHAQNAGWASSYIPRLDAGAASRVADSLYYDWTVARAFEAMTVLADVVEIGGRYIVVGRTWHLGQQGSDGAPRFLLYRFDASSTRTYWQPVADFGTADRPHQAVGSRVVHRSILHPDGAPQYGISVNGGAESLSDAGTARAVSGTYNRLQIGANTAGLNPGLVLLRAILAVPGVVERDPMLEMMEAMIETPEERTWPIPEPSRVFSVPRAGR